MNFVVVERWTASFDAPIRLKAADPVTLTGRRDLWDGHVWLWAVSPAGLEGWIPDTLVAQGDGGPIAAEDYSAAELTCQKGEILTGSRETHGWVLCRSASGSTGWVPRRNLAPHTG